MKQNKKLSPETAIKKQIKDYLNLYGWFCFPVLQALGAHKGISDMIACKNGITLFIEIKTSKSKQSAHQIHFQNCIEQAGCIYLLARSYIDVEKLLLSLKMSGRCLESGVHIKNIGIGRSCRKSGEVNRAG